MGYAMSSSLTSFIVLILVYGIGLLLGALYYLRGFKRGGGK